MAGDKVMKEAARLMNAGLVDGMSVSVKENPAGQARRRPNVDLDLLHAFWWRAEQDRKEWGGYVGPIKRARSFTLDDEAVEIVAAMAYTGDARDPKVAARLNSYRQLAKLPYPMVWLEFDYTVLDRWMIKHGVPNPRETFGKPQRLGFLMDRNTNPDVYRITTLGKMPDPISGEQLDAALFPVVHTVSTASNFDFLPSPTGTPEYKKAVAEGNAYGVSGAVAWGIMVPDEDYDMGRIEDAQKNPLFKTSSVEPESLWLAYARARGVEWTTLMKNASIEQRFDLRFVIAAMALLNHVPVRHVAYRPSGTLRPRAEHRPYMSTSIITVEVPATRRRVKLINDHLREVSGGWKNRRHEVKGHWRVSDKQITDKWERFHDPMSGKMRWRLWIAEHERGDASLGFVEQYHQVKGVPV